MLSTKLNFIAKLMGLAVLGLTLGVGGMFYYQKTKSPRRSMASVAPYTPHGLILGKQGAAVNVEIVGPATYPDNNLEVVELVGFITQHLGGDAWLTYSWTLPADVELVRGPISNSLANLTLGQPQQVSILVRGFSREKQKLISLNTGLTLGNTPLGASAVIVSRPEDTMEAKVMDLQAQAKAAEEDAKEAAKDKAADNN